MHTFNFFGRKTFQNKVFVIASIELGATFAGWIDLNGLRSGQWFTIIHIINTKTFTQIPKNQWTILFHFEMGWHVFSVCLLFFFGKFVLRLENWAKWNECQCWTKNSDALTYWTNDYLLWFSNMPESRPAVAWLVYSHGLIHLSVHLMKLWRKKLKMNWLNSYSFARSARQKQKLFASWILQSAIEHVSFANLPYTVFELSRTSERVCYSPCDWCPTWIRSKWVHWLGTASLSDVSPESASSLEFSVWMMNPMTSLICLLLLLLLLCMRMPMCTAISM